MQATVYKCEACGKKGFNERRMQRHEVKCLEVRSKNDAKEQFIQRRNTLMKNAKSMEELFMGLKELCEEYFDIKFSLFSVKGKYGEVSNSHGAPVGGVTNFTRDPDRPMSYPGFSGKFKFKTRSQSRNEFGINALCGVLSDYAPSILHNGTGSAGDTFGCYDMYFFFDDFPNLKTEANKVKVMGGTWKNHVAGFEFVSYEDEET